MKVYEDTKHYSEKHVKQTAACMADERLTGQERIHRLLTGKVELTPQEWLKVTAAVYMVAPARAAGIVEAAKSREGAKMNELLSDLRNQMSTVNGGHDPVMLRRIDTAILSCFAVPVFSSLTWRRMGDAADASI